MSQKRRLFGGRPRRRAIVVGAAVTATALGVTLAAGPWAWSDPAGATPEWASDPQNVQTITLITGDRVTIDTGNAKIAPRITPGEGREGVNFAVESFNGKTFVLPSDARTLVDTGKLDKRLFDVTTLIKDGYGDTKRDSIPLLTETGDGSAQVADNAGAKITASMPTLGFVATEQPKSATGELWAAMTTAGDVTTLTGGVDRVWLDGKRELLLDHSVGQIGAPDAWDAGYTGQGVNIAVLDTGIDADHRDLTDSIVGLEDFTGGDDTTDNVGHGTHVASTIAGSGADSGGLYRGVAPDANLLIGKVCVMDGCEESDILAGMEWAAEQGANIVNLSLGGWDTPEMDPLEQAVEDLTAEFDTLFVIAAGNDGSDETVGSPSSAPSALSVGAVDDEDQLAEFSSRGPRVGDYGLKPEITAPGVDIVAAQAAGTEMGPPVGDGYVSASGTSMATPHVAGTAALLAQQHRDWSAARLKAAIMASAKPNGDLTAFEQGAGRVDVTRAIAQDAYAEPSAVSLGIAAWPQQDDEPVTETVTLHNPGDTALNLDLALASNGPGGAAPEGMFTTNVQSIEIPAGGTATVDITTDLALTADPGYYTAHVTATDGTTSVVVPVGVYAEPESHTVSFDALGADGAAAAANVSMISLDNDTWYDVRVSEKGDEVRLPAGEYHVNVWMEDADSGELTLLYYPVLVVAEGTAVTFDARDAGPVDITVPNNKATPGLAALVADRVIGEDWSLSTMALVDDLSQLNITQVGEDTRGETTTVFHGRWSTQQQAGANGTGKIPQGYTITFAEDGFPTGYTRDVAKSDLAKIIVDYRYPADDTSVSFRSWDATLENGMGIGTGQAVGSETTQHEYINVTPEVQWSGSFEQVDAETYAFLRGQDGAVRDYEAGETYDETWGTAVIGPCAAFSDRSASEMTVVSFMHCEGTPGNIGDIATDSASTKLYFGDELVGESEDSGVGYFDSEESGTFRMEAESEQSRTDLSTRISSTWTFESQFNEEGSFVLLPTVRFMPDGLDDANTAPAGESTVVDYLTEAGTEAIGADDLVIEVSLDDGETWTEVTLDDGSFSVDNPDKGYVSLRAKGTDDNGSTFEHTIIHAYRVG
ncbi:S8 family serine peptidase [Stackebrandtia soli]|uniref:S8 family serine peptidase n=1 Tax=Stackebrandtia soli TaxID=1892856 RepID=UPI0039E83238